MAISLKGRFVRTIHTGPPCCVASWKRRFLRYYSIPITHHASVHVCRSSTSDSTPMPGAGGEGSEDLSKIAARLNSMMQKTTINGTQLREMVVAKWGRSYDVRLHKRGNRMYLQIMWKHLAQVSFPLTEEEYMMQLDAVSYYLNEWGVVEIVRQGIASSSSRGPGYTAGGGARCISIPLNVDLSAARWSEWS